MSRQAAIATPAHYNYDVNAEYEVAAQPEYRSSSSSVAGSIYERLERPTRTQRAPRSRTGCMTCRNRKVKCDERRPRCLNCEKLERKCNYTSQYTVKKPNEHIIPQEHYRYKEGCPAWDSSLPTLPSSRRTYPPDILAPFPALNSDEDRELKATFARIGRYFAIFTPRSFAHLPEYKQWQNPVEECQAEYGPFKRAYSYDSGRPRKRRRYADEEDPDIVFVDKFEPPATQASAQNVVQAGSEASSSGLDMYDFPRHSISSQYGPVHRPTFLQQDYISRPNHHTEPHSVRHYSAPTAQRPSIPLPIAPGYYQPHAPIESVAAVPPDDRYGDGWPLTYAPLSAGLSARSGSLLEEMVGMYSTEQQHPGR